jgi:hypothetical protein
MTRFMGPSRRPTKARVEDRAEPAVAPDGAGRGGFPGNLVLRPTPQVNAGVRAVTTNKKTTLGTVKSSMKTPDKI